jgi:hypothetical protein
MIERAKNLFDFANINLNLHKCEIMKESKMQYEGVIINDKHQKYLLVILFMKHLGISVGSRKETKIKFELDKAQKVMEERTNLIIMVF